MRSSASPGMVGKARDRRRSFAASMRARVVATKFHSMTRGLRDGASAGAEGYDLATAPEGLARVRKWENEPRNSSRETVPFLSMSHRLRN